MTGGLRKVRAVAAKEIHQVLRDRRTLLILLFVPAFFLLVYGYALNFDLRHIRIFNHRLGHFTVGGQRPGANGYLSLFAREESGWTSSP